MTSDSDLEAAHRHSSNHRQEVLASQQCGCFYCLATFAPADLRDWVDQDEHGVGTTALCPRCGIDSVIGSKSGVPLDETFLRRMRAYWFDRTVP